MSCIKYFKYLICSAGTSLLFISFVLIRFLHFKTLLSSWLSLSFSIFNISRLFKNIIHAFLNILVHFSTNIIIFAAEFICGLLSLFLANFSFVCKITLVSHKNFWYFFVSILVGGFDPFGNVFKTSWISNIESNDHSISFFVERLRESLESLLTCCIPYLDLDANIFRGSKLFSHEIQSECGNMFIDKLFV